MSEDKIRWWVCLMICLLSYAIFFSLFLVSISLIGLAVLALLNVIYNKAWSKKSLMPFGLMSLAYIPFLFSLIYATDFKECLQNAQLNVAYLFVPLSFMFLPSLNKKQFNFVLSFFIGMSLISTIYVLVLYFQNFDEITLSLGSGRTLPVPRDHVRFSIFLSFALLFSMILYLKKEDFFNRFSRHWYVVLSIYLFLFLHILAVRSGILISYFGILILLSKYFISKRKLVPIIIVWIIIFLAPIGAYNVIPSFKNKISYARYDLKMFRSGEGGNYSDSERLRSYVVGWEIWKSKPWFGTGIGDLNDDVNLIYKEKFGVQGDPKVPHNQLLKIGAAAGIVGLLIYLIALYFPVFYSSMLRDEYILLMVVLFFISFFIEATLERSFSLAFYLVFLCLAMQMFMKEKDQVT